MTTSAAEDSTLPTAALWFVPALMLLLALGDLPYGYYTLLRFVVCGAAVLLAIQDAQLRGGISAWTVALAATALLFNPLIPVHLSRDAWAPIDMSLALFLPVHYVACRRRLKRVRPTSSQPPRPRAALPQAPPGPPHEAPGRAPVKGDAGPAQTDAANALPPKTRLQEYEIHRVLGSGGFGITYLAFDHHLNGPVALKEYFFAGLAVRGEGGAVTPGSTSRADDYEWGLDRFLHEAQVLNGLNHPSIVRVHRYFRANQTAYIVMDYVEGESLADYLDKHGKLTPEQWKPWLDALLDGLEHVHRQDYLHRDVKPGNIVLRADANGADQPVLIDFGAARRATAGRTQQLTQVFSPGYAPIEQLSSTSRQGPFTDIYALAAVSYRVLTGEPAPSAADRVERDELNPLEQRLGQRGDPLLAALDSGLALRAADRPQTIAAWRALMRRSRPRTSRSLPEAPEPRVWQTPQRETLRVYSVDEETETSKGNRYVECRTDQGTVAFWGKVDPYVRDNIDVVTAPEPPFTVTCDCKPADWDVHDLWVDEDSHVAIGDLSGRQPEVLTDDDIPF